MNIYFSSSFPEFSFDKQNFNIDPQDKAMLRLERYLDTGITWDI